MFESLQQFLQEVLFSINDANITGFEVLLFANVLVICILSDRLVQRWLLPLYYRYTHTEEDGQRIIRSILRWVVYLAGLVFFLNHTALNFTLIETDNYTFRFTKVVIAVVVFMLARMIDWLLVRALIDRYYKRRIEDAEARSTFAAPIEEDAKRVATRTIQYVVYLAAIIIILTMFGLDYRLFAVGMGEDKFWITITSVLGSVMAIFIARLILWIVLNLFLYSYYRKKEVDIGGQYAVNQLLQYVIYIIAILWALDHVGVNLTVLWGAAAALLVGLGLGLQQTFNDLVSGIILLFERSVQVGDVVDVDGKIGIVRRIGIRTSLVETRDNQIVVVPNSKLIVDKVTNWSHNDDKVRFIVNVGVAYGSDTAKVKQILLDIVGENPYVEDFPQPLVRFVEFGSSSLDFQLHFWSRNLMAIEDVRSDLRFAIDAAFRKQGIEIPFPQRDVWFKNPLGRKT